MDLKKTKNPTPRAFPRPGQVHHVHVSKNGMVSMADENGRDMPQFGGPSEEILPTLKQYYDGPVTSD